VSRSGGMRLIRALFESMAGADIITAAPSSSAANTAAAVLARATFSTGDGASGDNGRASTVLGRFARFSATV
jgi:hypothetical protein